MKKNKMALWKSRAKDARFFAQSFMALAIAKLRRRYKPLIAERVSVITPTYNRLRELEEAIQSVRSQTYPHWEQVVVADGRDDRVRDLIQKIGDPRVRYYHTTRMNFWGNYQRNHALCHATGEFVLYLDDDNVIYERALETLVAGFSSPDIGYVISPIRYNDGMKSPAPGFRYGEIDLLNYMVRRELVDSVWGQGRDPAADYYLIDKVRQISQGVYLDYVVGHHR